MGCRASREGDGLAAALRSGSTERLNRLLEGGGFDANAVDADEGELPLVAAARAGAAAEVFSTLLHAGAKASGCASSSGVPILLVAGPPPAPKHEERELARRRAVAELLLEAGADADAPSPEGDADTPLLAAAKAYDVELASLLLAHGARVDSVDAAGNAPLHVAGALAHPGLVSSILAAKGDPLARNADGRTPIMCARLGEIATERRLSPSWRWCSKEVLRKSENDDSAGAERSALLAKGSEVYRCPSTGRCWSALASSGPPRPRRHEVAAAMALASGDAYCLADAIEGAWLDSQAPPHRPPEEVHPDIMRAIQMLVRLLQKELQVGLARKDAARLEAGLEMLWYANVAKLPEEERAIKMLVRMTLEQAVESRSELELKRALICAKQYGEQDSSLIAAANEALQEIQEARRLEGLAEQLTAAVERKDLAMLHALLRSGKQGLAERPEYLRAEEFLTAAVREELSRAIASCDRRAAKVAYVHARQYGLTGLPECRQFFQLMRQQLLQSLEEAAADRGERLLQAALLATNDLAELAGDEDVRVELRVEPAFRGAVEAYREARELPVWMTDDNVLQVAEQGGQTVVRQQLESEALRDIFQQLFDMTHKKVRTKDRRSGAMPSRLIVKEVIVVQNMENLIKYTNRREQIRKQLVGKPDGLKLWDLDRPDVCKTFAKLPDGRQFHAAWREACELPGASLDTEVNEFYLFHGTGEKAASAITEGDFRMDLAGSNAGTLYGRGIYFSECSVKSDEYAREDSRNLLPILVCRVTLGRILYTAAEYPSSSALIEECVRGAHHSVLGDRERCRGTFREMIVYDSDQAYPEFIVWYLREA